MLAAGGQFDLSTVMKFGWEGRVFRGYIFIRLKFGQAAGYIYIRLERDRRYRYQSSGMFTHLFNERGKKSAVK